MAPPKLKKAKSASNAPAESPKLAQVAELETALTSSVTSSLNPLADLLALLAAASEPEVVHRGLYAVGRVLSVLATQGRLVELRPTAELSDQEATVKKWMGERVDEFVTFCAGLLKDVERDLRAAAFKVLTSLLPILSPTSPVASSSSAVARPSYSSHHVAAIVRAVLWPSPSMRGGSVEFSIQDEVEEDEEDEKLEQGLELELDVLEDLAGLMDEKKDLRWAVYREASILLRPYLPPHSRAPTSTLASNLIFLLESQANFPQSQKELNEQSTLLAAFSKTPFSASAAAKASATPAAESDDWRDYFASDSDEDDDDDDRKSGTKVKAKKGVKGKKAGGKKVEKREGGRASAMSVHQGMWSLESHRAGFTTLWMSLLSLPLDASIARRILVILHHQVLPNMTQGRAVRTADWLGAWVDRGGPLGLLALNGLFILMTQYNLDYPAFYDRLYAMLDRSVLHVKYRSRFFRLTETFLSSSHLASTLVASFIKRFARLSLNAPPAAIIIIIPFIYNLLKMHPGCMVLIHRDGYGGAEPSLDDDTVAAQAQQDPYDAAEPSPLASNALSSSLWEIATLQKHYLSSVSSMAKIFSEVFTKPRYGMEDFLDHTFVTLIETETKRKIRNDPALALPAEGDAFPARPKRKASQLTDDEADIVQSNPRDVVTELWTF